MGRRFLNLLAKGIYLVRWNYDSCMEQRLVVQHLRDRLKERGSRYEAMGVSQVDHKEHAAIVDDSQVYVQ
ncbi:hypothetical protein V6N11_028747 [Hibiscus sabdariffa]|uniref:Uncharacterized protein n=1 Tax=Hibiscus sabdariffa TaxID=183260 RepID=A0ABR2PQP6_9ROSI